MAEEVLESNDELKARIKKRTREEEAFREDPAYIRMRQDRRRNMFRDILGVCAILLSLLASAMFYAHNYTYTTYSLDNEVSFGNLKKTGLYPYENGIITVGTDAVSFIENGTVRWTQSMHFEDPVFSERGSFFVICDRDSYSFYIGDRTGILASPKVSRKIQGIDISSTGVSAVFTENEEAAYITYFDRFGNRLSVEIKSVFTNTGYPLDISLSPDGQKLCVLYYSLQNGIGESQVILYDFQNGKSQDNYVVLKMEDFYDKGTLLMDAFFFDNSHFAVVGDKEIRFISYTNLKKAETSYKTVELSDNARSVCFSKGHLLLTEELQENTICSIYNAYGELISSFPVERDYKDISLTDRNVVFLSGKTVTYYNLSGRHRYTGDLVSYPVDITLIGRSLVVNNGEKLQKITFK